MIQDAPIKEVVSKDAVKSFYWTYRFDTQSNYVTFEQWLLLTKGLLVN
jgi:hypothetical protein